jgi:hypothetical protein
VQRRLISAEPQPASRHLGMAYRPLRRLESFMVISSISLLWAEGSESRAVERGPGCSKDIGVGKGEAILRTLIRTWATILNSFKRMVPHVASAKRVVARAMRRRGTTLSMAKIGCCLPPQRDSGLRDVANLRHRAKHSRHHTKDKQRLVVSVVAYDSLPGHHATLST